MFMDSFRLKNGTALHGRYRIERSMECNHVWQMYLAYDDELARRVMIKEYYPEGSVCREEDSPAVTAYESRKAWFSEHKDSLIGRMRSVIRAGSVPAVAQIYDLFEENGTVYVVGEYVEGEALHEYIKQKGKLPFKEAAGLLLPLTNDLHVLHERGVVHGGVMPENIVIRRETGNAVLLDCGEEDCKNEYFQSEDWDGPVMTPRFLPVECISNSGIDGRSDEYALCATLYCALTGEAPADCMARAYSESLQPPSALGADISGACEAVLLKGMSIRKEDRYPTIAKLREAFDALIAPAARKTEDKPVSRDQDDRKEPAGPKAPEDSAGDRRSPYVLKNGTVIGGEYKIIRLAGGGHYGYTYVGSDMVTDRRVAIREFFPSRSASRRIEESSNVTSCDGNDGILLMGKRRVYREAKAAYGMKNLVCTAEVRDVIVENDTVYVVMEYAEGETLYNYVKRNGALRYRQAADLMFPLLADLIRIHDQGGVHGNVNPHNIMIRRDTGEAVLLDFGATHSWFEYAQAQLFSEEFGPEFDAWEQRSMQQTDDRMDVFGFCISMYYALTGKNVKCCYDPKSGYLAPGKLGSDVTLACEQAIMRGLSPRDQRYGTIRELCQALHVDMDRLPKPPFMPDLDAHAAESFIRLDGLDGTGGEPVAAEPPKPPVSQEKTEEARPVKRKGKGGQIAVSLLVALAAIGVCVGAALMMMK